LSSLETEPGESSRVAHSTSASNKERLDESWDGWTVFLLLDDELWVGDECKPGGDGLFVGLFREFFLSPLCFGGILAFLDIINCQAPEIGPPSQNR
jgi:hypothetical protein